MTTVHAPGQQQVQSPPGPSSPPARRAPTVPRQVAFWLLALVLGGTMLGTTLPTPLYVIYQSHWHFSAAMVTVTFAVYAVAVIATLLPAGLGMPERGRAEFIAAGVAGFAAFALLGLFSSLVPGFLAGQLHQGSHAVQGAVVFLLLAVGTVTQVALSRLPSRRVVLAGLGLFLAALALIVAALARSGMALFLAGTVIGGVAVGAIFLGSLATANRMAPAERRGQAISAFFVACYAGLIIPVVGVGVLSQFTGTFPAVLTFSILLAALCLFSVSRFARGAR